MVRRVFFSFHYEKDSWRANVVRQNWLTKPDRSSAGYVDAAGWEKVKRGGDNAIKKWIDDNMLGTSVTVVLVGSETSKRDWVRYEVKKSHEKGKGLFAVHIFAIQDQNKKQSKPGNVDFGELGKDKNGNSIYFNDLYPTYYWTLDEGYKNFGDWVEEAAKKAGR